MHLRSTSDDSYTSASPRSLSLCKSSCASFSCENLCPFQNDYRRRLDVVNLCYLMSFCTLCLQMCSHHRAVLASGQLEALLQGYFPDVRAQECFVVHGPSYWMEEVWLSDRRMKLLCQVCSKRLDMGTCQAETPQRLTKAGRVLFPERGHLETW